MLKKLTIIICFAALAVVIAYGHSYAVWTKYYGGTSDDEGHSFDQTADGGFIVAGSTTSFGAGEKDVWLIKTDVNGDTLWTMTCGGASEDEGRSVKQTSDGGYIVVGITRSFGAVNADAWLIKTDAQGVTQWTKTYGGSENDVGNNVEQTKDGGYIIVGTTASFAYAYDDVWLIKTNSLGDTIWTRSWDINYNDDRGADVKQTNDGGFIVIGHSYYTGSGNVLDFTLLKTDSLGNRLWTKTYGQRIDQRGTSVDQTSDGGYILTGYTAYSDMTNPDVYVVKTNSTGDTTWTKTYGGSSHEEGYLIRQTTDGGYFIVGKTSSFGAGGFDVWVIKTDSNGDTLWTQTYGGGGEEEGYSGGQTADAGYIIEGYTTSFGAGGKDVFLIKLGPPPHVVSTTPVQNELNVTVGTNVSVNFDLDMDETSLNDSTLVVNARSTGLHTGTITYDTLTKRVLFDPAEDFQEGEVVTVGLTRGIESSGGVPLASSYAWSFTLDVQDGSGMFAPESAYPVGLSLYSVYAADLNGDGDLDLTTANIGNDNVSVLLNNGDGSFIIDSIYPVGGGPTSVFSSDLDGDGDMDIATANYYSNNVSVLLNNGDGSFAPHSTYSVGGGPYSIFSADLDGDGDMDLATANFNSDNVSVLLNYGDGSFAIHSDYPAGDGTASVFSSDLDGDGDMDLATASWNSGNVSVLLNKGDGSFATQSIYPVGEAAASVFSSDLDGDGDMDLATANYNSSNVSVLLNYGDGSFAIHSTYPVGVAPCSIFSSDLDGDGDVDLATVSYWSGIVSVLLNVRRGDCNGDGIVDVGDVVYLINYLFKSGPTPNPLLTGDANCSGSVDVGDVVYLINYLFKGGLAPSC